MRIAIRNGYVEFMKFYFDKLIVARVTEDDLYEEDCDEHITDALECKEEEIVQIILQRYVLECDNAEQRKKRLLQALPKLPVYVSCTVQIIRDPRRRHEHPDEEATRGG